MLLENWKKIGIETKKDKEKRNIIYFKFVNHQVPDNFVTLVICVYWKYNYYQSQMSSFS